MQRFDVLLLVSGVAERLRREVATCLREAGLLHPVEEGVDEWTHVLFASKLTLGGRQLPERIVRRVDGPNADLDYRTLSNAGLWCIGPLQTDADRARVLEGLASATDANDGASMQELGDITKRLAQRWFLIRDVHAKGGARLLQPRWAMSFMRGPMTASEIRRASSRPSPGV